MEVYPLLQIQYANSTNCVTTALLVLGIYKELLKQFGLRRLLILNLCCTSLAVLYSITSCKSMPLNLCCSQLQTLSLTPPCSLVWLHQEWTTKAALLSFLFDLIGGGDSVRITIICKCIADISPPEKLWVLAPDNEPVQLCV